MSKKYKDARYGDMNHEKFRRSVEVGRAASSNSLTYDKLAEERESVVTVPSSLSLSFSIKFVVYY